MQDLVFFFLAWFMLIATLFKVYEWEKEMKEKKLFFHSWLVVGWSHLLSNNRLTSLLCWNVQVRPMAASGLMSASFLITCCIHLAIYFDQVSCAFVTHTFPKHQRSTSMFHSRNGVPFIIGLVDSSPNIMFMVVAKKLNFGLITQNYFVPEVLRLVSVLFGIL